jgi:serine/threonine protein kinase/energy-coupling factor transporter ATP-binding protein EcfA2
LYTSRKGKNKLIKKYKVLKEIKSNVCLVKDLKDNQLILKQYPKNESQYKSIYLHEIEALKKLQHTNIVKIEHTEEDENNYYILFKYIYGENFVNNFSSLVENNKKCDFFKSTIKILETLDYIHSHNFIHKDIKPSNIIIDSNNNPYILDFGTATISNTITRTQQDLSLWYASPEQKNNQEIDATTDLYSFGITLIEALVSKEIFDQFTKNIISIDEVVDNINICDDGINEEMKNVIKKLTYKDKYQRYQRAKEVVIDIKGLLEFFNCDNKYELNISDNVKKQLEEDFNKPYWDILEFIENKINNEIKYIEYGKDRDGREEIKLATTDFILYCGIKNEEHFYVFRYSQRVPDSVKQNGHIIDDEFILTSGHPTNSFNYTSELIDKLERLNKQKLKKLNEDKEKKSFLDKTQAQLKIERAILDKKNISLFAQKLDNGHKKGRKELIVKVINISNIKITKEHLKDLKKEEEFIHQLSKDGFIDDPNNQDLLKLLNELIESYFFESNGKDISKKLFGKLTDKQKEHKNIKHIEDLLTDKYKEKRSNFEKLIFNAQRLFDMYPEYLIKQKEEDKFFEINDDVIIEGIEKKSKFKEKFTVKNIDISKKQITLKYNKEISKIPNELKISFDYDKNTGLLKKQEYSIKDLKNNKTTIENLLSKISNPNTLAPKREIPKLEIYFNSNIDENQQEAVNKALSLENGEYLVIQGPPGTGKTTVITEIINQILEKNKLAKILVTSQSNQAVDNVLEKICESESKIVRFGNDKSKLSQIASKYHEEAVFDKYLQEVKAKLNQDNENYFLKSKCLDELHRKWKHRVLQGDNELKTLLFKKIRVIFGTLVGISSWQDFRAVEFDYIIVDEAGRATLPELMIPLRRAKRFILVGDHKQLPPIVDDKILAQMKDYNKQDLKTTLFEELYNKIEHDDFKHFLKFNYRSHESITKIYSNTFYNGEIETKDFLTREHGLNFSKKVYFYSTSKLNNRFDKQLGTGKKNDCNRDEIIKILMEIEEQAKVNNIKKSVGIITPYLAQRDNIRSKFGQIQNDFNMLNVEINSVDAFQGSDRDIIIYDIVRSQDDNKVNIEFIADEKRLNVALSRTKELLFIVGDAEFIYNASIKDKNNPYKTIIEILSKDKENYEIKELKNEK